MGEENKLGKNITILRKFYKKSLLDMANDLGVSKSSLSQYESGKRRPEPQILQRIATYFRVTVTELENREYTTPEVVDINKLLDEQTQKDASIKCFPIISNEDCLKNEKFKKAYDIHKKLKYAIINGEECEDIDEEKIIELYKKAYEENVIEGIANILSLKLMLFLGISMYSPILEDEIELLDDGEKLSLSKQQLIDWGLLNTKEKFLNNEDKKDIFEIEIAKEQNDRIREFEKIFKKMQKEEKKDFIHYIAILKRNFKYNDLADFYIALGYITGLYGNECTNEENRFIGNELLDFLNKIGNKYARRVYKIYFGEGSQGVNDKKK